MLKKIKKIISIILFLHLVILVSFLYAQDEDEEEEESAPDDPSIPKYVFIVKAGVEKYFGYTSYQLGGKWKVESDKGAGIFPKNEYIFPLDTYLASLDLGMIIKNKYIITLNAKKNFITKTGESTYSEWGTFSSEADSITKDFYGTKSHDVELEGKTKFNMITTSLDFQYKAVENSIFSLKIGAAFFYQHFGYDCSDGITRYPSYKQYAEYLPYDLYGGKYPSKGNYLTYSVNYLMIPVLKIIPGIHYNRFEIEAELSVIPYVKALDSQEYPNYKKIDITGSSDGWGISSAIQGKVNIINSFFIAFDFKFLYIAAKGTQEEKNKIEGSSLLINNVKKNYDNGYTLSYENYLESKQYSLRLELGYTF